MKALSLMPEWAMSVLLGWKTVECRTWKTDYRGELLICASSKAWPGSIAKHALCIVNLVDIVPFEKKHLDTANMDEMPEGDCYAWIFDGLGWVKPFEVKALKTYYEPLLTWHNRTIKEEEIRSWWNNFIEEQKQNANS